MTRNILSLFIIAAACLVLGSCRKYSPVENDQQVGISKITYYANITMNGDANMSIVKGAAFTDPGATAEANGQDLPVTTTGTVDANTVGLYPITYSATNKDGYPASVVRNVAVIPSHEIAGTDISGDYYYIPAPATSASISKLAEGFYYTSNLWSGATTIPGYLITVDGSAITIPTQVTGFGTMFGSGTLTGDGALTYSVSIPSQGLNNVARRWHLQ